MSVGKIKWNNDTLTTEEDGLLDGGGGTEAVMMLKKISCKKSSGKMKTDGEKQTMFAQLSLL